MEGSQRYDWLPPRRNGSLLYVSSESDDKEGADPRSRDKYHAKYHAGKGTYTNLGRKETPNVGRSYKGPRL